jgi:molecular chaperone Hsp33
MGYVVRGLAKEGHFRLFAVECREVVEEVRRLQGLSPVVTAAVGRALAGVAMLAADLKKGKVLLQIQGGGPVKEIIAEGDAEGNLRATVRNPWVEIPPEKGKLPVGKVVGKAGYLSVVKDLGLREPYQGSVKLVSGEIAEDLAYYLTVSEQIPSAVSLGVLVDTDGKVLQAGGFMVQKMPDATEEEVAELEEKIKSLPPVTKLLSQGYTPEAMLKEVFPEVELLERREVRHRCQCSLSRVEETLIALGKKELEEILKEGKPLEVTCNFCKRVYKISLESIKNLLEEARKRSKSSD